MLTSRILPTLTFLLQCIHGERILFFQGFSSYSQHIMIWPLAEALAARGHQVTFLSPHVPRSGSAHPNLTVFSPKPNRDLIEGMFGPGFQGIQSRLSGDHMKIWYELPDLAVLYCDLLLANPEVLAWAQSSEFDLLIIDSLFGECGLGLGWKFRAPHIDFSTTPILPNQYDVYGVLPESSSIPDPSLDYPLQMSLRQRTVSTLHTVWWYFMRFRVQFPPMEKSLRDRLSMPDMPPLRELERTPALVFVNSHYSVDHVKALPPNFVSITGIQCKESGGKGALPEEMSRFIDRCGDKGFIYASFGTVGKISSMPADLGQVFSNAFGNSSTCIVLKWDSEDRGTLPANVFTSKWIPQQELLSHPSIKAFLTHGGALSTQEAVFHNVPLLVVPLFAEQDYNAEKIHRIGHGIRIELVGLTQAVLETAIRSITTEQSYKVKMSQVSSLFKDRPIQPLESAVWWTEFVLRQKDTSMLRPYGAQQTWYERRLLDVWGLIGLALLTALLGTIGAGLVVAKVVRVFWNSLSGKRSRNLKGTKKTK